MTKLTLATQISGTVSGMAREAKTGKRSGFVWLERRGETHKSMSQLLYQSTLKVKLALLWARHNLELKMHYALPIPKLMQSDIQDVLRWYFVYSTIPNGRGRRLFKVSVRGFTCANNLCAVVRKHI